MLWVDSLQKLSCLFSLLTLSQTTNFRLFQTVSVCRWQSEVERKWKKILQKGRKHCGKRRYCLLREISPFPTVFSKHLYSTHMKNQGLFGKGLILYQMTNFWTGPNWKNCQTTEKVKFSIGQIENILGKRENAGYQHFLLFLQCFQKAYFSGSLKVGIV